MITIPQALGFPHGTPIEEIQGMITSVYEQKTNTGKYGPYTTQSGVLRDIGGNEIRLFVFDHEDLSRLKGKEVIVRCSSPGKGVSIKRGSYVVSKDGPEKGTTKATIDLRVDKKGVFFPVAVYTAPPSNPAASEPPSGTTTPVGAQNPVNPVLRQVHGQTVGMAINNVCEHLTASGSPLDPREIWKQASAIVKVAQHMEAGHLYTPTVEVPVKEVEPPPTVERDGGGDDEDDNQPF